MKDFHVPSDLHINFYEDHYSEEVILKVEKVRGFIDKLRGLL